MGLLGEGDCGEVLIGFGFSLLKVLGKVIGSLILVKYLD